MKKNSQPDKMGGSMDFEHMLRQYFGDKSYGDRGLMSNERLVKLKYLSCSWWSLTMKGDTIKSL